MLLDAKINKHRKLEVEVPLDGPLHVFKTGRRGHTGREYFDFDGRRWLLRFRAFETNRNSETTHGQLVERAAAVSIPGSITCATDPLDALLEKARIAAERREGGWVLRKTKTGVQATFDLSRVRLLPSRKIGSFASFNIDVNGTRYLGQFHITEQERPTSKPTERDWSRGPKAGLPSLGKRR
jgi:hypothetical protein